MPSFFSGAPKETPSSDFSTTNAEMPLAPLLGVGHGHDRVVLRDAGVGDPPLHAVEHPVVAVADRPGLHRDRVRAGLGLGQAVGEAALAAGERAEVVLLELLGPGQLDRQRAELVDRRDQRRRTADPGDLLDHQHRGQRVGTGAAVLLGHVRRVEVRRLQRGGRLLRVAARARRRPRRTAPPWPRRARAPPRGSPGAPRTGRTAGCRALLMGHIVILGRPAELVTATGLPRDVPRSVR